MKIAIVSVLALVLLFLAFKLKKSAKQKNDQGLRIVSMLFFLKGLNFLVLGNTYLVLNSKGWSTENMYNMVVIAAVMVGLSMLFIGAKIFLNSKKKDFKLGMLGAAIWMLVVVGGILSAFKVATNLNSGWTKERKETIINKCPDVKFKKLCYLEQVMAKFPNPEDYNKITPKQLEDLNKSLEENCLLCDLEREKEHTQEVEGLPDDF